VKNKSKKQFKTGDVLVEKSKKFKVIMNLRQKMGFNIE